MILTGLLDLLCFINIISGRSMASDIKNSKVNKRGKQGGGIGPEREANVDVKRKKSFSRASVCV